MTTKNLPEFAVYRTIQIFLTLFKISLSFSSELAALRLS